MPALSSPATWRTHRHEIEVFAYISQPATILQCDINQSSFEYPLSQFTYDGAVGDYTAVKQFMTVKISDGSGNVKGYTYIRELPTSSLLYIGVASQGDFDLQENDVVEVLNDFRIWARIQSINDFGELFKDWVKVFNEAVSQPPVSNASPWYAKKVDGSNIITVDFDGTNSFPIAPSATLSSYAWDEDDGTITVGSDTSSSMTATFPAGERWVELEVTDSDGTTHKAHTWVVAATDATALSVEVASLQGDVENGWQLGLRLLEGDVSDYLPGSPIIVWVEERYGNTAGSLNGFPDREHVIFAGWLTEENISIEPLQSDWDITAMNAVGIVKQVPAINGTTEYAATASSWFEISEQNLWRHAHYLMEWHSTLLAVCDVERPAWYNLPGYIELEAEGQTLHDQLAFVANAQSARFTCDRNGRCYFRENPQFMTTSERSSLTTTVTLADTDWSDSVNIRRRHRKPVRILWGEGLVSSTTEFIPKMSVAPGTIPGQGEREERLTRQLLGSASTAQADINTRTGRAYAVANLEDPTIPIKIFLGGMVADPAWQEKIVWTLSTDKSTREYGYSSQQFGLASVRVSYDHSIGATEEDWELEKLVDTTVIDGITVQLPGQDPPASGVYIPTYGTLAQQLPPLPPPAPLAPLEDEEIIVGILGLLWNADLYTTDDVTQSTPTFTSEFDDATDSVLSVIHTLTSNFFSDNSQALPGMILTDAGLWSHTDLFGDYYSRVPTITEEQTFTGGQNVRHVPHDADAYAVWGNDETSGAWTVDIDFTATDGEFVAEANGWGSFSGVYTGSVGWEDTDLGNGSWERSLRPLRNALQPFTITEVTITYDMTAGAGSQFARVAALHTAPSLTVMGQTSSPSTGAGQTFTATQTVNDVIGVSVTLQCSSAATQPGLSGTCTMTAIQIKGTGFNPFADNAWVRYTDDFGANITKVDLGIWGSTVAGDSDDFGNGIHIGAAEKSIFYTTAFDGSGGVNELTGLTGIDGSANVTCVRVPYRKLATQALNNDATSLQFIYATDAAVSGSTLWGVTFNTTNGTIIAQSDMTPIISATTYYVVGAEALETAGVNTQVILAACKPVGGGDTELLLSTDGGSTWTSQQTEDIDFVRWLFGSSTQATLSGDAGAWLTQNRGVSIQDQIGSLTGETGILGFIGFPQA